MSKINFISGALWVGLATIIVKLFTMASQIVLGFYLDVNHFGYYASALGYAAIFSWLKNGAVYQIVIKRSLDGLSINELISYASFLNIVSSIGISAFAVYFWTVDLSLSYLLFSIAFAQLFSLPELKIRAYYSKVGKFRDFGFYEMIKGFIRNSVLIVSAFVFQSIACFALAIIIVAIYDLCFDYALSVKGAYNTKIKFKKNNLIHSWSEARWLLVGSLGSALIMQGGFLVLGLLTNKNELGIYFFSFQLVSLFSLLVCEAINKVLMPVFASIKVSEERKGKFLLSLNYSSSIIIPVSFSAMLGIGPVIDLIWGEKWAQAIFPAQLMVGSLFIPIMIMLCYSYLEANNKWRVKNLMQILDGLAMLLAASIGALCGGVEYIVSFIILRRIVTGFLQLRYTCLIEGIPFNYRILGVFCFPFFISGFVTLVAVFIVFEIEPNAFPQLMISVCSLAISFVFISVMQYPDTLKNIKHKFKSR